MRTKFFRFVLFMFCMLTVQSVSAAFKDIRIDLTGQWLLTDDEFANKSNVEFGIVVNDDGTFARVEASDASANAVIKGKYHNDHGWGGVTFVIPVDGAVKIGIGNCTYAGHTIKVTDSDGTEVASFETEKNCWKNNKTDECVTFGYYKSDKPTTLTIVTSSYTPFISVEPADPTIIPDDVTVTYTLGDAQALGTLPEAETVNNGAAIKIPLNRTLFADGKTLTAWTDGADNYAPGQEVVVTKNLNLTPVFTDNTVSLADRNEPVTLKWDFQRQNGAPLLSYQNATGLYVTQTQVNGSTIDVKLDFDTNNGGKIANGNWTDWCQFNNGTKFTIPSCKDATVSLEAYATITTTTIDGQKDYAQGTTISYTVANPAETVAIVIGDGSYYRYIQTVLPVVKQQGGTTFTDEPASVAWAFNEASTYATAYTANPDGVFSMVSVNAGDMNVGTKGSDYTKDPVTGKSVSFVAFTPTETTSSVDWSVIPVRGLTFTPKRVSAYINRFGTDARDGVVVTAKLEDGTSVNLGTFTAKRANKDMEYETNKWPGIDNVTDRFDIELTPEQQQQLTSADGFTLSCTVGVNPGKQGGFSEVRIDGVVNGAKEEVAKYTLAAVSNPVDGGEISVYPEAAEYEEGTEVQLTAEPKFGYDFVNWTDAENNVVSTEAKFKYAVTANATLTANFNKVNTYELSYNVEGGANLYMVQPNPAPTVVDGKNMYEEGTTVTLTAQSNKILTFTNWNDGTSNSEKVVEMTENKVITAQYSVIDFIAGWDFYKAGGNGRKADFASQDNDADALNLVNEATGETSGWLDKSQEGAGGYEGKPAAVNWRIGETNGDVGHYYWQTMVNATAFTNIRVSFEMLYNYNSYTKYNVEYSFNGTDWNSIENGSVTMEGAKKWTPCEITLPAETNNAEKLYIRWIADKTSTIDGTPSKNDGNAIADIYILGDVNNAPDPVAPALVTTVPEEGAENSSATGKIVLTFDKRVKVKESTTASLNGIKLEPIVFGKTITFQYKNLDYSTDYVFTLPAGSVTNMNDVALDKVITINFKTMSKPEIAKALYDFVVPDDGAFEEAIAAADSRTDKSKRFRIFVKAGSYKIPQSKTETITCDNGKTYPSPMTKINSSNISIIGEDMDGTVVENTITDDLYNGASVYEQIGKSDVLQIQGSVSGLYFQDITIKSAIGDKLGRNIAIQDKGTKNIYKDVCLHAYQDTWVSNNNNGLYYFEGGRMRGRTDFLCGKGDIFFNAVDLVMCEKGGYIAVPSQSIKYGYVFRDCTIKGEKDDIDGNYTLGRPWGSGTPIALYINTKMEVQPSAVGWNEMSGGWPKRFAEYNSMTSTGTVIPLDGRKKVFGDGHTNNPVLTEAEALEAGDMSNMFGDWQPTLYTEQAQAPTNVAINGTTLTWDNSNYVLCWAVCKNGAVIDFTTEPVYTIDDESATWTVRAANEMGGLGEASGISTDIDGVIVEDFESEHNYAVYNLAGQRVNKNTKGILIVNGKKVVNK